MVVCNEENLTKAQEEEIRLKFSRVRFTNWDVLGIVVSILSFVGGICFTVTVSYLHYVDRRYWYCGLTAAFLVVPSLIMTFFSAAWYIQDDRRYSLKPSSLRKALRVVSLVLQMAPILRYVDYLFYWMKSRRVKGKDRLFYIQRIVYEENDAAILMLFEGLIGNAPQLVLQIYILTNTSPHPSKEFWKNLLDLDIAEEIQLVFILMSLVSLAWSLTYYHKSLRISLPEKEQMSCTGSLFQLLYHSLLIGSRVLGLALLAYLSPVALIVFYLVHWALMTGWIVSMKTAFCENRLQELLYNASLGAAFIFCYLNPVDTPTLYRYLLYYCCVFLENTSIMIVWYYYCEQPLLWFRPAAFIIHYLSFAIGILLFVTYYLFFHPNGKSQLLSTVFSVKQESQDHKTTASKSDVGNPVLIEMQVNNESEVTNRDESCSAFDRNQEKNTSNKSILNGF